MAKTIRVPQPSETCGTTQPNEQVLVGRGGALAGAIVWLDGLRAPTGFRPRDVTLDQRRCRFEPHVQTATVGATLTVASRDALLHNVHALIDGNRTLFNLALPVLGMNARRTLSQPGRIRFKCDAGHTWMSAHLHVFPHPYHSVTNADGRFRIQAVPPGGYTVRLWHERLGERSTNVTVATGGTATVSLQY